MLALIPDKSEAVLFSTASRAKRPYGISTVAEAASASVVSKRIKLLGVMLKVNLNFR